jgi:hypothetical protein
MALSAQMQSQLGEVKSKVISQVVRYSDEEEDEEGEEEQVVADSL